MDGLKPCSTNTSPLTPIAFLDRAAAVYGDSTSLVYNSTTFTWSDTHARCLRLASALSSSLRIVPGDVVSVFSPNVPAIYELHFAVPMAGAVLNCINTRLDPPTVSTLLLHSTSKLIFLHSSCRSVILRAISLFPSSSPRPLLVLIADPAEEPPVNLLSSDFVFEYESLLQTGDPSTPWKPPASEWDPIVLNYTSGTTASPKGVVHSHRGIFTVVLDILLDWSVPKNPVYLWTLPMFHANGWSFPWGMAVVGGTNICLRRFDSRVLYDSIARHRVTHMCCAPVVLNMLCSSEASPLSSTVHVLTAGASPPPAVLERTEALGFAVSHGYGLTETGGIIATCAWKKKWDKLTVEEKVSLKARRLAGTACVAGIDVVDPGTGRGVEKNGLAMGEIVVKGPSVMLGYLKDPDATARVMKKGWLFTGDVGVVNGDGYVEIKDRSKDVIISGGENLSSIEVEAVLYTNPAVEEAAVVARPDEYWGETPCAFVSWRKGVKREPTEAEIVEYCRERLPHFMAPRSVVVLEELPKTATGKIQKFVLRDMARRMGPPPPLISPALHRPRL